MDHETWTRAKLDAFVRLEWGDDAPATMTLIDRWLARGDGAAIYRNNDLSSAGAGEPRIVSYGSADAQLEDERPPEQLPDGIPAGAINWRFRLEAVTGGPAAAKDGER